MDGGVIAYLIIGLLSILTTVGIHVSDKSEIDRLHKKAEENKATTGDLARLLDIIKTGAQALSFKKRTELANNLNRLGNSTYISSGLSEEIMNRVKQKLTDAATKIEQLRNMGDVESSASDNLMQTYSAFSDEDKGNARKIDEERWKKDPKYQEYMKKMSEVKGQHYSRLLEAFTHSREKAIKAIEDEYKDAKEPYMIWTDTAAGQVGKQAEEHADKAKEYYQQANELGELYA